MNYIKDMLYLEIGKTLELIQLWENKFKELTIKSNIEKSEDKRSLSNMNNYLLKNKIINEYDHQIIKKVIESRNYIIHKFFIEIKELDESYKHIKNIKDNIEQCLKIFE